MQPTHVHTFENGAILNAFSLKPDDFDEAKIAEMLAKREAEFKGHDFERLKTRYPIVAEAESVRDLEIIAIDEEFEMPEPLEAYRVSLGEHLDKQLKPTGDPKYKNGPIAVVNGGLSLPMTVKRGGYYDFKATQLDPGVANPAPGELLPEVYGEGTTVRQIVEAHGIGTDELARYFGIAFILCPSDGEEMVLDERDPSLGLVTGMSFPGCTPKFLDDFFTPCFDYGEYIEGNVVAEMGEEYALREDEVIVGRCILIENSETTHFGAVEVRTPKSVSEIADTCPPDEHPMIYGATLADMRTVINQMPVFDASARVIDHVVP